MQRLIKWVIGGLIALLLLVTLTAVLLPLLFDTEDLKHTIEARGSAAAGRPLEIAGDLSFSVFPWLAVQVEKVSLGNAAGFGDQPMARIESARAGVALLPLLRRELVVDQVRLDGLRLDLQVNSSGSSNWDGLGGDEAPAEDSENPFSSRQFGGLDIRDARIELRDAQAGAHLLLDGFRLETGPLLDGGALDIELETLFEDRVAGLRLQMALSGKAQVDLDNERYHLEGLSLSVEDFLGGETLHLATPAVTADLGREFLGIETFELRLGTFSANGALQAEAILGTPRFEGHLASARFDPRQAMRLLDMEPGLTADNTALTVASLQTQFSGTLEAIDLKDFRMRLDDSTITGRVALVGEALEGLRFDIDVDAIDLDRYMAPPATTGDGSATETPLPRDALQGLDLEGRLRVGELMLSDMKMARVEVGVQATGNAVRLHPLTADLYGGTYRGDVRLNASGDALRVSAEERIESVAFQALMGDLFKQREVSGTAAASLKVSGAGNTAEELMRSLRGDVALRLDDGALEGVNVWHEMRKAYAKVKGRETPEPTENRTVFSRLQFQGDIRNGVITTRQLQGALPFLDLNGNGDVDLVQQQFDLGLLARVRKTPELAQDPLAESLAGRELPLKINGPLAAPKVSVDVQALLRSEATNKLLDRLGGGDQETPGTETTDKDQLKDAARGLLKGLLDKEKQPEPEPDEDDG